jgi:arylsulfatase A-like enzyme
MRQAGLIGGLIGSVLLAACTGDGSITEERSRSTDPDKPPNVLIIVTDDQRLDTMGALPQTRRIFGEGGTRFSHAYTTTPQCCPSRASIMTGQYSHNHGVLENNDGDRIKQRTTLQARLQRAGYLTALTGKYLQGRPVSEDPPFFDRWATVGWGYYHRDFNVDGVMTPVADYSTDFIADTAVSYLEDFEREDDRPWFVYVAPTAPHLPYTAARRYRREKVEPLRPNPALREADLDDKPRYFSDPLLIEKTGFTFRQARIVFRRQMRTLLSVDDLVGDVFAKLDRLGETRETLAFFISDNGHLLGEHGLFGKRLPYEASIRVPLYMTWPGRVPEGATDDRLAAGIDLAPTILPAAGIDAEEPPMDGRSLLADARREMLLLEQYKNGHIPDWVSLLTRGSQYVEYEDRRSGERLYGEFYDLKEDRWQVENLLRSGNTGARVAAARAAMMLNAIVDCEGEECP